MTREQYEYSDMFWSDPQWNVEDGIPKFFTVSGDSEMNFHYLNNNEIKEFLSIKMKENPDLLRDMRYKKIIRILKNN